MKHLPLTLALIMPACAGAALAHDKWWNGKEIDAATKRQCCGDNDVHHLMREQVKITPVGYVILATGEIWQFFWGGSTACFFAPVGGV